MRTATEVYVPNPVHGLVLLMMHQKPHYFAHLDDCRKYTSRWRKHPFGLQIPATDGRGGSMRVIFVGAEATDISVEVFLVNVRFWIGHTPEDIPTKLRVLSSPAGTGEKNQHYVFFEIWACGNVIISGETTDYSDAGNSARCELEDIFAVLALVYKLEIERVKVDPVSITELYAGQVV